MCTGVGTYDPVVTTTRLLVCRSLTHALTAGPQGIQTPKMCPFRLMRVIRKFRGAVQWSWNWFWISPKKSVRSSVVYVSQKSKYIVTRLNLIRIFRAENWVVLLLADTVTVSRAWLCFCMLSQKPQRAADSNQYRWCRFLRFLYTEFPEFCYV